MSEQIRAEIDEIENLTASSRQYEIRLREELALLVARQTELQNAIAKTAEQKRQRIARRQVLLNDLEATIEREKALAEQQSAFSAFNIDNFKNEPWYDKHKKHQWDGAVSLAIAKRGLLADGMGLGKTMTSLIWTQILGANKVLVIAPNGIVNNFTREISKWTTLPAISLRGKTKAVRQHTINVLEHLEKFVVVVNYEAWRKDHAFIEALTTVGFDAVICDEAHSIKDTATSAFKGVEAVVTTPNIHISCGKYVAGNTCHECETDYVVRECSVKYFLAMTGTPLLNRPTDIYPLLHLIDKKAYPSRPNFIRNYCNGDFGGDTRFTPWGRDALARELGDRFVARTRFDANIELPEQSIVVHEIEFPEDEYIKQQEVIATLNDRAAIILGGESIPILAQIAVYTRLRQANVWPGGIELKWVDQATGATKIVRVSEEVQESIKIDYAIDLIMQATLAGEKVVLFSQFTKALEVINNRLHDIGIKSVRYDGETPQSTRNSIEFDFDRANNGNKYQVVLAQYKSGGVGLNFTAATQCIILDEEWNPGKRDQAYARLDRLGQTEKSTVHVLRIPKTIDDYLARLMDDKQEMVDDFDAARIKFSRKDFL